MARIDEFMKNAIDRRESYKQDEVEAYITQVYDVFPTLRDIDERLLECRKNQLLEGMAGDDNRASEYEARIKQLEARRAEHMDLNGIPEDFDKTRAICKACSDTGYRKTGPNQTLKVVCNCMRGALDECYKASGMGLYEDIKLDLFDSAYCGSEYKTRRDEVKKRFLTITQNLILDKDEDTYIYTDREQRGKTFLAISYAKVAIGMGVDVQYVKLADLYNASAELLDRIKACDMLIVDDFIGRDTGDRNVALNLANALEYRLTKKKVTILISMFDLQDIVNTSDARVAGKISKAKRI